MGVRFFILKKDFSETQHFLLYTDKNVCAAAQRDLPLARIYNGKKFGFTEAELRRKAGVPKQNLGTRDGYVGGTALITPFRPAASNFVKEIIGDSPLKAKPPSIILGG